MFGKKRIWQKTPRSTERPQVKPGTPGQAEHPPTADALIAVKQQLQREIADRKLGEDQLKIHLDRLEQRIKGQSGRLIKIKEQLKHRREELTERPAHIKAANEQLQQQVAQREHYLNQKLAVLTRTVEQLQHQVGDLNQKEIELLEGIIDAEQPGEQIQVLNPQELKALSELAKRLA